MKTTIDVPSKILAICNKSTYLSRDKNLNCFYVYIHYDDEGIPFYIGQGSHNRAYKKTGRSEFWNKRFSTIKNITIEIIKSELSFKDSLDLEKTLLERNKNSVINMYYGHSPNEAFSVLCFTLKGEKIKRYDSSEQTLLDGFNPATVRACCGAKGIGRNTYKGHVWCYEKDYKEIKDTLFNFGKTVKKPIEVIFPDGTIKTYKSMNETEKDGLLPDKVRLVLNGTRKFHKGCSFKFI